MDAGTPCRSRGSVADRSSDIPPSWSAARRPISRAWRRSACRCRPPLCSRSPLCARPRAATAQRMQSVGRPHRRASHFSSTQPARGSATAAVRCWSRCAPARRGRCRECWIRCSMSAAHSAAVRGLVRMTGHPRFASDCRRRFLESYGDVVLGIDPAAFVPQAQRTDRRRACRQRTRSRLRSPRTPGGSVRASHRTMTGMC